jgi:hypothetical protein
MLDDVRPIADVGLEPPCHHVRELRNTGLRGGRRWWRPEAGEIDRDHLEALG